MFGAVAAFKIYWCCFSKPLRGRLSVVVLLLLLFPSGNVSTGRYIINSSVPFRIESTGRFISSVPFRIEPTGRCISSVPELLGHGRWSTVVALMSQSRWGKLIGRLFMCVSR